MSFLMHGTACAPIQYIVMHYIVIYKCFEFKKKAWKNMGFFLSM